MVNYNGEQNVELPKGGPKKAHGDTVKQAVLNQIGVTVEAFIGKSSLTIGQLNALKTGSIIELDAHLGRDVEVRLDGMCIGRGELVAVGDKFAVKLVELGE